MEQNLVRRKCDFCEDTMEFVQNRQPEEVRADEAVRIAGWATLVRVHVVNGQIYPVQKHACKDSCAKNIIDMGMLGLPKEIQDAIAEQKRQHQEMQKKLAEAQAKQAAKEAGVGDDKPMPTVAEA